MVEKTGRVIQVGAQQRSDRRFQLAVALAQNGAIGKLKQIWVALPYYTTKGGPFPTEPVPEHIDWDMYQGQAPVHDYCRQRTHQSYRWWHEYAGGIITDWGNHHIDIAQWAMDCNLTGPVSVNARGLFPNPKGCGTILRFGGVGMIDGEPADLTRVEPNQEVRLDRPSVAHPVTYDSRRVARSAACRANRRQSLAPRLGWHVDARLFH